MMEQSNMPGGTGPAMEQAAWNPTPTQAQPETWSLVASAGDLYLAQSSFEYAVYDTNRSYGRWPLTNEGYGLAVQMYEAHNQSLAHGIAYAATGYQDPARLGLPTEPVMKSKSYAAPLSFVGSTRRIVAWANSTQARNPAVGVVAWVGAAIALLIAWTFLVFWYFLIFGLFGVFVIPYRLVRRSQRKNMHVQQTSLATQQAMLQQMAVQQQALAQQVQAQQMPVQQIPVQQMPAQQPLPAPQQQLPYSQ